MNAGLFDHVILCLPTLKDTLWLECTSQNQPFGFQGSFTADRQVLIIEKENSKIVRTKKFGTQHNVTTRKVELNILNDLNTKCNTYTKYHNISAEEVFDYYLGYPKEEFDQYLSRRFDIPSYSVSKYDYNLIKSENPILEERLDIDLPYYANFSGNRIFVVPNLFSKSNTKIPIELSRKEPYYFEYGYSIHDSIFINIPEGYKIESSPKTLSIEEVFGKYFVGITKTESQIIYTRFKMIKSGSYASSNSILISNFFKTMHELDRSKIVFVKK
jgi:hypothetical protein